MPVRFAEVVNWGGLRDTVLYALVAGVGITAAFGFLLLGGVRARERYEAGQLPQAVLYGIVALAGLLASATGIILGLIAISET